MTSSHRTRRLARGGPCPTAWLLAIVGTLLVLAPRHAAAWAEATVRSVQVRIAPRADGEAARYQLEAEVRVRGGWLQGLALEGFAEPIAWDATTPTLTELPPETSGEEAADERPSSSSRRWQAEPRRQGGRWWLQVQGPRFRLPRRGRYLLRATWSGPPVEAAEGAAEGSWSLPPWRNGLQDVRIELLAPRGARPLGASTLIGLQTGWRDEPIGTWLRWSRAQLPRSTPWTVQWRLPGATKSEGGSDGVNGSVGAPERHAPAGAPSGPPVVGSPRAPRRVAGPLAVLMLLQWGLGLLWARRQRLRPVAAIRWPGNEAARGLLLLLCALAAVLLQAPQRLVAAALAVLLAWRRLPELRPRPTGGWVPGRGRRSLADRLAAGWWDLVGLWPWDGSRPVGLAAWLLVVSWLLRDGLPDEPLGWARLGLLLIAPWSDGAARHPTPPRVRRARLLPWLAAMPTAHGAWRLVELRDRRGRLLEARVDLHDELALRLLGQRRMQLAVLDVCEATKRRGEVALLGWPRHEDEQRAAGASGWWRRLPDVTRLPGPGESTAWASLEPLAALRHARQALQGARRALAASRSARASSRRRAGPSLRRARAEATEAASGP